MPPINLRNVGKTINHPVFLWFIHVYTTHLWWFRGWFINVNYCFNHTTVVRHQILARGSCRRSIIRVILRVWLWILQRKQTSKPGFCDGWFNFLELNLQWTAKIGRETSPINGLNDIFLSFGCARGQSWNNNTCFFSCEQFARWPACVANKQLGGAGRQKKICLETYGNHSPVYCNLRFFFWLPHVASLFFFVARFT